MQARPGWAGIFIGGPYSISLAEIGREIFSLGGHSLPPSDAGPPLLLGRRGPGSEYGSESPHLREKGGALTGPSELFVIPIYTPLARGALTGPSETLNLWSGKEGIFTSNRTPCFPHGEEPYFWLPPPGIPRRWT